MFAKILIANRGEIACRVARTARRLGARTVAVYSEADAAARHVALADEAVAIGPAPARESYLRSDRIVDAARRTGAEAVHPGYGFLAENAEFAEACAAAGIVFIGPPPAAIRAMGDKAAARALMRKAGVPVVPGYDGDDQSPDRLAAEARTIGFPVLIKPSAGGGGKGMRRVDVEGDFPSALAAARREAEAAFGDARVLVEKYIERPRHVEVQIFCDAHGNAVHLYERDCSIQRRHQKVLEEAPAPGLAGGVREAMTRAALAAARAIDYTGAGTVEMILAPNGEFWFMEMNTRLQVEHPVTEQITGLDLVEWQLRVAAGEPLPRCQEELRIDGHAIEARLYAEDPARDFVPATGHLTHLRFPEPDACLRIDSGVREGDTVTVHYDPMIAKIIARDRDRDGALRRLLAALRDTEVVGVTTNLDFLATVLAHPAFREGSIDTGFIERHRDTLLVPPARLDDTVLALAALDVLLRRARAAAGAAARSADPYSPWHRTDGWRLNETHADELAFIAAGERHSVTVSYARDGYRIDTGTRRIVCEARLTDDGEIAATLDGVRLHARVVTEAGGALTVLLHGARHRLLIHDPARAEVETETAGTLVAPMPGTVIAVLVEPGARVTRGTPLLVLEAMKMEHTIKAPIDGVVKALRFAAGDPVPAEGAELVVLEPAEL